MQEVGVDWDSGCLRAACERELAWGVATERDVEDGSRSRRE